MSAQPGWYDAGVPAHERWWDGSQWTAHERAVPGLPPSGPSVPGQSVSGPPVPGQSVSGPPPLAQPQYAAPVAQLAPMGWFPVVGTADVRWWDGAGWTPYRLRDRRVRPDSFNYEPGNTAVMLGSLFIGLGLLQVVNYSLSSEALFAFTPVVFVIAGVIWLIGGIQVSGLKKLPPPSTVPVFDPLTRPLPCEVEGAGAAWYPVSGKIARWWTGTQWSPYVAQKLGVRPTQFGPRAYRNAIILGWVLAGVGVLGAVFGFALVFALGFLWGLAIAIPALVFALVGGLVVLMVYIRRYAVILPPQPPPLR